MHRAFSPSLLPSSLIFIERLLCQVLRMQSKWRGTSSLLSRESCLSWRWRQSVNESYQVHMVTSLVPRREQKDPQEERGRRLVWSRRGGGAERRLSWEVTEECKRAKNFLDGGKATVKSLRPKPAGPFCSSLPRSAWDSEQESRRPDPGLRKGV